MGKLKQIYSNVVQNLRAVLGQALGQDLLLSTFT